MRSRPIAITAISRATPRPTGPAGEVEELKAKDPIDIFRAYITGDGGIGEQEADGLADKARKEVDAAIDFARNSPYPEPEEALEKVFV